ncbi:MAG: hypothetical protein AAFR23_00785, partial [Pseudomonadota bacterium]
MAHGQPTVAGCDPAYSAHADWSHGPHQEASDASGPHPTAHYGYPPAGYGAAPTYAAAPSDTPPHHHPAYPFATPYQAGH